MLGGRLGATVAQEAAKSRRFVDLFAGSGVVSHHVATKVSVSAISVDQLKFATVLAASITRRVTPFDGRSAFDAWSRRAAALEASYTSIAKRARELDQPLTEAAVVAAREFVASSDLGCFIWRDYGGYYLSPGQAFDLSMLYRTLPRESPQATAALAALIRTASRCSASPGHTAQPFRPTSALLPHIRSAWRSQARTVVQYELESIARQHARVRGFVFQGDAQLFVERHARRGDLLFCDPPYSDAQYSRFYHLLEAIAIGGWESVQGAGRAPESSQRVASDFSRPPSAIDAMTRLISSAADLGCVVMLTYPEGDRSNRLSSDDIKEIATPWFAIEEVRIPHRHSTLGGSPTSASGRAGRKELDELLLTLRPRA